MKKFFVLFLFLISPITVLGADYCVSGAGSPIDGEYSVGADIGGYPAYYSAGIDAVFMYTGYYEIRLLSDYASYGYYHDSAGSGGSYLTIDSINNIGVSPVPSIVSGGCSTPTPTPSPTGTSTVATSTEAYLGTLVLGNGIIITLLFLMVMGFLYNSFSTKKPWR